MNPEKMSESPPLFSELTIGDVRFAVVLCVSAVGDYAGGPYQRIGNDAARASSVASIGALIHDYPQLTGILAESLQDNEGEVLAHLIMSDVFRWLETNVNQDRETCQSILDWLEREFERGDDHVKDLIGTSGVEMIPDPGQPGAELRDLLGPLMWSVDPWNPRWRS